MNEERKTYWNETYYQYWKARVEESKNSALENNSHQIQGDVKTSSEQTYIDAVESLNILPSYKLLELGCGFGRNADVLYSKTPHLYFVDISESMLRAAREGNSHRPEIQFFLSEAEHLPFETNTFDRVMCFSVFDALFQKEALIEMNRVMNTNGLLYLTGKNSFYFNDDEKALTAEINARAKKHPNSFTHVKTLLAHLSSFGFSLCNSKYYLRRGDTYEGRFQTEFPDRFYEYALTLKKDKLAVLDLTSNLKISAEYSETFLNLFKT